MVRIIPVIDLLAGLVVRGVGGRRDEYRPIVSRLVDSAEPEKVGRALVVLGFRQVYVADLDAIMTPAGAAGPRFSWAIYRQLAACGLDLWIDAGLRSAADAEALLAFDKKVLRAVGGQAQRGRITGIIAGLESIPSPEALTQICHLVGPKRLIFSLDLKLGIPLTSSTTWDGLSAQQIALTAFRCGVRRIIVLDLARVGMGDGVGTELLCRSLACRLPGLEIIAGGGVRGPGDLDSLGRAGCDGALVASALHDGRLGLEECVRS